MASANNKGEYKSILTRIAKKCEANYSSSDKSLFDKIPATTTKPMYHMARVHYGGSTDSFKLLQNQIIFLDCKARNGKNFNKDEKEFLKNLFEAMWWGSKARGFHEAGKLADAYVNSNAAMVTMAPDMYKSSKVVQTAMKLMKDAMVDHYNKSDTPLSFKSIDKIALIKIVELRKRKRFNQSTEGEIYANGILKSEETNLRLFYADNRFYLQAKTNIAKSGNTKKINITWRVEGKYDFEPYNKRPWDITRLPVAHPGTRNRTPGEVQNILSQTFPEYMKVNGNFVNGLMLPDGLSNYMVKQGVAKEFNYNSSWSESLDMEK